MKKIVVAFGDRGMIREQLIELSGFIQKNSLDSTKADLFLIPWDKKEIEDLKIPEWIKSVELTYCPDGIFGENLLKGLENYLKLSESVKQNEEPWIMIFSSDSLSQSLAVRFSKRSSSGSISFVKEIEIDDDDVFAVKSSYSSNLSGKFRLLKKRNCISIDKGFKGEYSPQKNVELKEIQCRYDENRWLKKYEIIKNESEKNLQNSKVVVVAGKGIGSKDNIQEIREFAEFLKGELGGTRPVVMNGWLPMELLVGVSGNVISPELCLVLGASGQGAFASGIRGSKKIIAVNIDKDSGILKQSDLAFQMDYRDFIKKIKELI